MPEGGRSGLCLEIPDEGPSDSGDLCGSRRPTLYLSAVFPVIVATSPSFSADPAVRDFPSCRLPEIGVNGRHKGIHSTQHRWQSIRPSFAWATSAKRVSETRIMIT